MSIDIQKEEKNKEKGSKRRGEKEKGEEERGGEMGKTREERKGEGERWAPGTSQY